jgi:hypothetical protein
MNTDTLNNTINLIDANDDEMAISLYVAPLGGFMGGGLLEEFIIVIHISLLIGFDIDF